MACIHVLQAGRYLVDLYMKSGQGIYVSTPYIMYVGMSCTYMLSQIWGRGDLYTVQTLPGDGLESQVPSTWRSCTP